MMDLTVRIENYSESNKISRIWLTGLKNEELEGEEQYKKTLKVNGNGTEIHKEVCMFTSGMLNLSPYAKNAQEASEWMNIYSEERCECKINVRILTYLLLSTATILKEKKITYVASKQTCIETT